MEVNGEGNRRGITEMGKEKVVIAREKDIGRDRLRQREWRKFRREKEGKKKTAKGKWKKVKTKKKKEGKRKKD